MDLSTELTKIFRLTSVQQSALRKLRLSSVRDLLFHFPFRYEQEGSESSVAGLVLGAEVSVFGVLEKLETKKSWKRKIPVSEGYLSDTSGHIKLMWFNQPYIAKMYQNGTRVKAVGKVTGSAGKLYLANPQLQKVSATEENLFSTQKLASQKSSGSPQTFVQQISASSGGLFSQYPESPGITS